MMKHTKKAASVAISNIHNGQICYPTVQAARIGGNRVHVTLVWIDQSQPHGSAGREYGQAEFSGTVSDAERWLMGEGVHLDAQGIY